MAASALSKTGLGSSGSAVILLIIDFTLAIKVSIVTSGTAEG